MGQQFRFDILQIDLGRSLQQQTVHPLGVEIAQVERHRAFAWAKLGNDHIFFGAGAQADTQVECQGRDAQTTFHG